MIVLPVTGIVVFALIYSITHRGEIRFEGGGLAGLIPVVVFPLVLVLLPVHEWIHGLAMRRFGASPSYGAMMLYGMVPCFYCTSPGHRFTRSQFAVVSAAPLLAISLVGGLCVALVPYGGWLVLPLGFHLGGCVGDLWFLGIIAIQPRGTLLEDTMTGVRLHRPVL